MAKLFVIGMGLKLFKLVQVGNPAIADGFRDQLSQAGVTLQQPATGGNAISLVGELVGPQLIEVL